MLSLSGMSLVNYTACESAKSSHGKCNINFAQEKKDCKKFVLASNFVACCHTLNYLVHIPAKIVILVFLPTNCPDSFTDCKRALAELWWSDILPSFNCLLKSLQQSQWDGVRKIFSLASVQSLVKYLKISSHKFKLNQ